MKMRAVSKVTSWMNPMALIVHPNPTEGNSVLTILGKISPPVALPHAACCNTYRMIPSKTGSGDLRHIPSIHDNEKASSDWRKRLANNISCLMSALNLTAVHA